METTIYVSEELYELLLEYIDRFYQGFDVDDVMLLALEEFLSENK